MRSLAAAAALAASLAFAHPAAACAVEDWRWYYTASIEALGIEGVANCESGRIALRMYDQDGDRRQFLGVDDTFIENRSFRASLLHIKTKPSKLVVEFSIQPDG